MDAIVLVTGICAVKFSLATCGQLQGLPEFLVRLRVLPVCSTCVSMPTRFAFDCCGPEVHTHAAPKFSRKGSTTCLKCTRIGLLGTGLVRTKTCSVSQLPPAHAWQKGDTARPKSRCGIDSQEWSPSSHFLSFVSGFRHIFGCHFWEQTA